MARLPDLLLFPACAPCAGFSCSPRWPLRRRLISSRPRRGGGKAVRAYDGTWNVVFATTRGNCSSGYSVPFAVAGTRISSAGGGRVSGSVNRAGAVAVNVSVGTSQASSGGRLAGASGAGAWHGIITGDRCSGTWQATRS